MFFYVFAMVFVFTIAVRIRVRRSIFVIKNDEAIDRLTENDKYFRIE
jgi:hypothetical protein